jgi:hypothetical protein
MEKTIKQNSIKTMLDEQKKLLGYFIPVEGLPKYPVDLNSAEGQKVLREMCHRMIEELSEAFTEIVEVYELVSTNKPIDAQKALRKYNEEIADCQHFLCNLLLFSGIEDEDLWDMIKEFVEEFERFKGLASDALVEKPFKFFMVMGEYLNYEHNSRSIENKMDRFTVATEPEALEDPLLCGGRRISEKLLDTHAQLLWNVVNEFYKLVYLLRIKPWSMKKVQTQPSQYRRQLMLALISWGRYLDFIGMGEIALVNIFRHKTAILITRMEEGY